MTREAPYGVSGVHNLAVSASHRARVTRYIERNKELLTTYEAALVSFNRVHNLVSRSAENELFQNHIRHCLAITCYDIPPDVHVVDWGSGGGLPAIPLAISFPDVQFTAVDKVGKKTQAVEAIARRMSLKNVSVFHGRAEEYQNHATFSVSRATAPLSELWKWHTQVCPESTWVSIHGETITAWPPGLICLKGGDLTDEIKKLMDVYPDLEVSILSLEELFDQPYYREKVIIHVQCAERT